MTQGAPKGNEFWKLRTDMSEDGRKISVKDLKIKIQEYIDRCVNETLKEIDFRGKGALEVEIPKMIAMSIWGASAYIGISDSTWRDWKKDNKYSLIITRAETIFKAWNAEGSAAGFLNSSIISRIDGHKDQKDITSENQKLDSMSGVTFIITDDKEESEEEK